MISFDSTEEQILSRKNSAQSKLMYDRMMINRFETSDFFKCLFFSSIVKEKERAIFSANRCCLCYMTLKHRYHRCEKDKATFIWLSLSLTLYLFAFDSRFIAWQKYFYEKWHNLMRLYC